MNFARRFLCASAPGTLDRILLGWGFLIFAAAQGLAAQSDDWHKDLGIRWSASSVVPPLTISGIVINVVTGEPVARAQVYLEDLRVGAVTDAEGRFDFQAPGPGEFVLSAMGLAYDLVSDTIRLCERSGLLIQIGLVWEHMTPEELRSPQGRLSLPCGTAVVSDAISNLEYQLSRGGGVGPFPGLDSASTVGVTRDPSLCQDILAALPDDLQRELLAETWEFQIEQFGETFVVVLCPWPIPRIQLDDACRAYPVQREGDDFSYENVVLMYW